MVRSTLPCGFIGRRKRHRRSCLRAMARGNHQRWKSRRSYFCDIDLIQSRLHICSELMPFDVRRPDQCRESALIGSDPIPLWVLFISNRCDLGARSAPPCLQGFWPLFIPCGVRPLGPRLQRVARLGTLRIMPQGEAAGKLRLTSADR
jgi:hypothetical protein